MKNKKFSSAGRLLLMLLIFSLVPSLLGRLCGIAYARMTAADFFSDSEYVYTLLGFLKETLFEISEAAGISAVIALSYFFGAKQTLAAVALSFGVAVTDSAIAVTYDILTDSIYPSQIGTAILSQSVRAGSWLLMLLAVWIIASVYKKHFLYSGKYKKEKKYSPKVAIRTVVIVLLCVNVAVRTADFIYSLVQYNFDITAREITGVAGEYLFIIFRYGIAGLVASALSYRLYAKKCGLDTASLVQSVTDNGSTIVNNEREA